jgi:hypothetical protein
MEGQIEVSYNIEENFDIGTFDIDPMRSPSRTPAEDRNQICLGTIVKPLGIGQHCRL